MCVVVEQLLEVLGVHKTVNEKSSLKNTEIIELRLFNMQLKWRINCL